MVVSVPVTAFRAMIDGVALRGEIAGDGEPVVLLHAGICDRRMWHDAFGALAERYLTVRYDLRGFGDSVPDATHAATPFSHHTDLLAVLDHLGIARAALVGASFGGQVALDTAIAAPDGVSRLATVCSFPGGWRWSVALRRAVAEIDGALDDGDLDRANEAEIALWIDGPRRGPDEVNPGVRRFVAGMNRTALGSGFDGEGERPLDPPAIDRLAGVRCPTLVMIVDLDLPDAIAAGEHLARAIAAASLHRFPDAAHLPALERPDRFLDVLDAFLNGVPMPDPDTHRDRP